MQFKGGANAQICLLLKHVERLAQSEQGGELIRRKVLQELRQPVWFK
jgi:hypothetical protein